MNSEIPLYSLYGQIDTAAELRFVHLESLEARNRLYDWNIRPHRHHDLYQLIWVDDGMGTVVLDDQSLVLQSPVLISIPPPTVHGFRWHPGTGGLILTIAESFVAHLVRQSDEPAIGDALKQLLVITGEVDIDSLRRIRSLFGSILDEYVNNRVCRGTAIAGNVLMLFAEVARLRHLSLQHEPVTRAGKLATWHRFKELIEVHYSERWSMADYARALMITERSLRRLCTDLTGRTPAQIIQHRILVEAKRSLIYTEKTVAETGYELGFDDPAYFTRFFTRIEGETPTRFRRMRRRA